MKVARVERLAGGGSRFHIFFECGCTCVVSGERGDGERTITSGGFCDHIEDMTSSDLRALMSEQIDALGRFGEHADGIVCVCGAATWESKPSGTKCACCRRKQPIAAIRPPLDPTKPAGAMAITQPLHFPPHIAKAIADAPKTVVVSTPTSLPGAAHRDLVDEVRELHPRDRQELSLSDPDDVRFVVQADVGHPPAGLVDQETAARVMETTDPHRRDFERRRAHAASFDASREHQEEGVRSANPDYPEV